MKVRGTYGERNKRQPQPDVAGRRPSSCSSGRLSGRVRWLARPAVVPDLPALESALGVFFDVRRGSCLCVLQYGQRPPKVPYWPPVAFLHGLVPRKRGSAQEGPANGPGSPYRPGAALPGARGRQCEGCKRRGKTGRAALFSRDRDSENRAAMKTKSSRYPQSPNQESFNHSIRNLLIRESPNQLINQSRRHPHRTATKARKRFRISPVAGRMAEQPKTQTTRGGGLTASASGITNFLPSARQRNQKGCAVRGNLDCKAPKQMILALSVRVIASRLVGGAWDTRPYGLHAPRAVCRLERSCTGNVCEGNRNCAR